jgi:hypothetical protein
MERRAVQVTPLVLKLWGAAWTGYLALVVGCVLRWLRIPHASWRLSVEVVDLVPATVMLILIILYRSSNKIAVLIAWLLISLFAVYNAWATFPLWGEGIFDANPNVKARFEAISTAADTLQNFAAIVLGATGLWFLILELSIVRQRRQETKSVSEVP